MEVLCVEIKKKVYLDTLYRLPFRNSNFKQETGIIKCKWTDEAFTVEQLEGTYLHDILPASTSSSHGRILYSGGIMLAQQYS